MDKLPDELSLPIFVDAAGAGEGPVEAQIRNVLQLAPLNRRFYALFNIRNARTLLLQHGNWHPCPAITSDSIVETVWILWSDATYCRRQYGAPPRASLVGKEGYDLNLMPSVRELYIYVHELSDFHAGERLLAALQSLAPLLANLQALAIHALGKGTYFRLPTTRTLQLLRNCLQIRTLVVMSTESRPADDIEEEVEEEVVDVDPFASKLYTIQLRGHSDFVKPLLSKAVVRQFPRRDVEAAGFGRCCTIQMDDLSVLSDPAVRDQLICIDTLWCMGLLPADWASGNCPTFPELQFLQLQIISPEALEAILPSFPGLLSLCVVQFIGRLPEAEILRQAKTLEWVRFVAAIWEIVEDQLVATPLQEQEKERYTQQCRELGLKVKWSPLPG